MYYNNKPDMIQKNELCTDGTRIYIALEDKSPYQETMSVQDHITDDIIDIKRENLFCRYSVQMATALYNYSVSDLLAKQVYAKVTTRYSSTLSQIKGHGEVLALFNTPKVLLEKIDMLIQTNANSNHRPRGLGDDHQEEYLYVRGEFYLPRMTFRMLQKTNMGTYLFQSYTNPNRLGYDDPSELEYGVELTAEQVITMIQLVLIEQATRQYKSDYQFIAYHDLYHALEHIMYMHMPKNPTTPIKLDIWEQCRY